MELLQLHEQEREDEDEESHEQQPSSAVKML